MSGAMPDQGVGVLGMGISPANNDLLNSNVRILGLELGNGLIDDLLAPGELWTYAAW